jgi:hypothetical protein
MSKAQFWAFTALACVILWSAAIWIVYTIGQQLQAAL